MPTFMQLRKTGRSIYNGLSTIFLKIWEAGGEATQPIDKTKISTDKVMFQYWDLIKRAPTFRGELDKTKKCWGNLFDTRLISVDLETNGVKLNIDTEEYAVTFGKKFTFSVNKMKFTGRISPVTE